jgi:Fe2+ or Zn2+ uptake regulation protein
MELARERRNTLQRRLVYEAVAGTHLHPTAEWVYARVRREMPRVSLGTVYRNLQLLVAEGRLRSWARGRTTRYDADLDPHDHFSCRRCGLLVDLPRAPRAYPEERRLRSRGHEIEERILEFVGICRDCRHGRKTGGKKR